jgi:hypothetical protein
LMLLSVNGTAQSYAVIPERSCLFCSEAVGMN